MNKTFQPLIELVQAEPYAWLAALFLLIILVQWLVFLRVTRKPKSIEARRGGDGSVTIVRSAITGLVQKAAEQHRGIAKCHPTVANRRDNIDLALKLQVRADAHVGELTEELTEELRNLMRDRLGIERVGTINHTITGFVGDAPRESLAGRRTRKAHTEDDDPSAGHDESESRYAPGPGRGAYGGTTAGAAAAGATPAATGASPAAEPVREQVDWSLGRDDDDASSASEDDEKRYASIDVDDDEKAKDDNEKKS